MILGAITHPELLAALANAGHTSKVLVADGHYPIAQSVSSRTTQVHLNFAPGSLTVTQVLKGLRDTVVLEAAVASFDADGSSPAVWQELTTALPPHLQIEGVDTQDFLRLASSDDVAVAIATGDVRSNTCVLLTIGVRHE